MAAIGKRQRQDSGATSAPKQRRTTPKSRGEVYKTDAIYIEDYIIGKSEYKGNERLIAGLYDIPAHVFARYPFLESVLEREADMGGLSFLEKEVLTAKGTMKMNEKSSGFRFWEAMDGTRVTAKHQATPPATLSDFAHLLHENRFVDMDSPMHIVFTATVVRTDRLFADVGESDGGDSMQILPCGWARGDVISRDLYGGNRSLETSQLKEMVYKTYVFSGTFGAEALGKKEEWKGSLDQVVDPVPVEPRRGSCFRLVGKVTEVHGCEIEVFVKQEERMFAKGFEKAVTVHLPEGVEKPEVGSAHVLKGVLEPLTKAFKDMKFIVEVCEKVGEKSS